MSIRGLLSQWPSTIKIQLRPKKIMCVSDQPTDPNIFYTKKNNRSTKCGNSSPVSMFVSDFNKFSSFPCTFDRCLEPVLMIQQSYNGRDVNSSFHMEREVWPLSRNPNFQSTIAVYIFWKIGKQFCMPRWWPDGDIPLLMSQWPMDCTWRIGELWHVFIQCKKKKKLNPYLPTLILKTI